MYHRAIVIALSLFLGAALAEDKFKKPHYLRNHDVLVYMLEWKWNDIADECEKFLGPMGFGGVQTSPVTENIITDNGSWLERYLPISYRWITRSGDEREFRRMVRRCNKAGVRVYVDLVINHMARDADEPLGCGGSVADMELRSYPAVPYEDEHFHPRCEVEDWSNVTQLRDCQILGHDLDHGNLHVWGKISKLMNNLIDVGVAGFRIDFATYMWPNHLQDIYSFLSNLNTKHNFPAGSYPYIYQEVISYESGAVSKFDYDHLAAVTEYDYNNIIKEAFLESETFDSLNDLIEESGLLNSEDAVVCLTDPRTERADAQFTEHRGSSPYRNAALNNETAKLHKMTIIFMLAYPYGNPMIISSYAFTAAEDGPPADDDGDIISPIIEDDGSCKNGWLCEHRWPQIRNMIEFRNVVSGTRTNDWWKSANKQMAFSRGYMGFIAMNADDVMDLVADIPTSLPPGLYCDVISGNVVNKTCSGKNVTVETNGKVHVEIPVDDEYGVIAIHRRAKLWESIEIV